MIVQDLIETTEFFTEETKEDFFVIYEKFANSDCNCDGNILEEIECDDEEIIGSFVTRFVSGSRRDKLCRAHDAVLRQL